MTRSSPHRQSPRRDILTRAGAMGIALALSCAPAGARAGMNAAPIPLHFKDGTSSAEVFGKVTVHGTATYSVVAEAGQMMAIELASSYTAPIEVSAPGGISHIDTNRLEANQSWTGTITKSGPIEIVIHGEHPIPNNSDADASSFRLNVSIFGNPPARVGRIEEVDFYNGTVSTSPGTVYQLKDGKLARPDDDKALHVGIRIPRYGTIDGYAGRLAEVFVVSDDSGTGLGGDIDLFALEDGLPVLVTILTGGDRADGGFRKAWIEGGHLIVEVWGAPGGGCCPEYIDTVRYRLNGGKLVRVGNATRRPNDSSQDNLLR